MWRDVAGGDRLDAEALGEVAEHHVAPHVTPLVRPLQLDEEPLAAERAREPGRAARIVERQPVTGAAREADEPLVQLGDGLERDGRRQRLSVFPPRTACPGMSGGEDPAKVRVALPALAEQGDVAASSVFRSSGGKAATSALERLRRAYAADRHLGAGDRPDAGVLRGVRELEGAVDAVVVGKGERRVAELRRAGDELLGMRGAVEERVRRVAVELDIRGGTHGSPTDTLLHRTSPTVAHLASRPAKPASGRNAPRTDRARPNRRALLEAGTR